MTTRTTAHGDYEILVDEPDGFGIGMWHWRVKRLQDGVQIAAGGSWSHAQAVRHAKAEIARADR